MGMIKHSYEPIEKVWGQVLEIAPMWELHLPNSDVCGRDEGELKGLAVENYIMSRLNDLHRTCSGVVTFAEQRIEGVNFDYLFTKAGRCYVKLGSADDIGDLDAICEINDTPTLFDIRMAKYASTNGVRKAVHKDRLEKIDRWMSDLFPFSDYCHALVVPENAYLIGLNGPFSRLSVFAEAGGLVLPFSQIYLRRLDATIARMKEVCAESKIYK